MGFLDGSVNVPSCGLGEVKARELKLVSSTGYSKTAQCTGKSRSYLEPNSRCMQKTYRGEGRVGCRVNRKQCCRFI